ncbi:MAG: hypothetical protein NVS3B1_29540 [Marmoricola sp.]
MGDVELVEVAPEHWVVISKILCVRTVFEDNTEITLQGREAPIVVRAPIGDVIAVIAAAS